MRNKSLKASIIIGGSVSSTLRAALGSTEGGLKKISAAIADVERRQRLLGDSMKSFGRFGAITETMRRDYAKLTDQLDRMRKAQERLNLATKRHATLTAVGGKMQTAGMYASVGGAAIVGGALFATREAKNYQSEVARIKALGLGDKVTADAQKYAAGLRTYGTSQLENLTLVRDAMSVFGDLHHAQMAAPILAKMKFGNAAFFGAEHGAENEAKFMDMLKVIELRGGTKSRADFEKQANMVQKVISATGGRVGPEEWRHLISTGGLAAKSMRDDAFFYQLEPLVQEMGGDRVGTGLMTAYSSLYQGHASKRSVQNMQRLGLVEDESKVHFDKAGQMAFLNPGALKGAELFKKSQFEWMKQVLLPTLAKKGLTSKDQVLDAIGSIFSSRKGADLMAAMYLQQQQIEKSERLNRGAADINTIDKSGRTTAAGKELNAAAKLADAKLRFGAAALPIYASALDTAAGALERFNRFADKHATLVKVASVGILGIGAALVTLGPILTVAGTFLNAYAAIQLRAASAAAAAARNITAEAGAIEAQQAAAAGAGGVGGVGGKGKFGRFAGKAAGAFALTGLALEGARMLGLPDVNQAQGEKEFREGHYLKASAHMDAGSFIKALFVGLPQQQGAGVPRVAPGVPTPKAPVTNNNHQTYNFNITQQPGESSDAFAHRVAAAVKQQQTVANRGQLHDGVD
jgi:hypothetical protein